MPAWPALQKCGTWIEKINTVDSRRYKATSEALLMARENFGANTEYPYNLKSDFMRHSRTDLNFYQNLLVFQKADVEMDGRW